MGDAPAERNKEHMTAIKAELEAAPSLKVMITKHGTKIQVLS